MRPTWKTKNEKDIIICEKLGQKSKNKKLCFFFFFQIKD